MLKRFCFGVGAFLLTQFVNAQDSTILKTPLGYVKGAQEGNSYVFKGVPYAEMLTAQTKFLPPIPKKSWRDTLSCMKFGDCAPQYGNKKQVVRGSENALFLNIYTPVKKPNSKMSVVVWVHGGSMTNGQGADMDGRAFSDKDGIVTVTINYRLGILGFLYLNDVQKGISGNNGLLDLISALQFLQKNIASFGGDPKQITVMGESAGAKLVSALLVTDRSQKLFNQLILESGAIQCVRDTTTALAIRKRLMDTLGIKDPSDFLQLPLEQLMDAQNKVLGGAKGTNYFGPVADGNIIPFDFVTYLTKRNLKGLRFLIGSNKAESRLFMEMDKRLYNPNKAILESWFGSNGSIVDSAIQHFGKDSIEYLLTQYMYAMHTHRLAKMLAKKESPLWLYRFDYDAKGRGATHGQELSYIWHRPSSGKSIDNVGFADMIHQAWCEFIKGGKPLSNWNSYAQGKSMMVFDAKSYSVDSPQFYEDKQFPISCLKLP